MAADRGKGRPAARRLRRRGVARPLTMYELTSSDQGDGSFGLFRDGSLAACVPATYGLIDALVSDVTLLALARSEQIAIHAGVASRAGRAVLLPAPPDSGKSTLTAALVMRGWSFLSDEVAALDEDGRVHPFPRPLVLEPGAMGALRARKRDLCPEWEPSARRNYVTCDDLRASSLGAASDVAAIVMPRFIPGATADLRPASRAQTLKLLTEQCFNLPRFGSVGFRSLGRLVERVDCFRLDFGDVFAAASLIEPIVAREGSDGVE